MKARLNLLTKGVADFIVDDLTERYKAGIDYEGNPQADTESARDTKIRAGRDTTPLIGVGKILSDPAKWSVTPAGNTHLVNPPAERLKAIEVLEGRGYKIIGISEAAHDHSQEKLSDIAREMGSDLSSYIEVIGR